MTARSTVALVDDHPIALEGLETRLIAAGLRVVAGSAAVEYLPIDPAPTVVVCDMKLPGRSGAAAVTYLVAAGCRVLATSGVATIDEVLDAIAAGAHGFLAKTAPPATFVTAVRSVCRGDRYVSADLASYLLIDADRRPLTRGDLGAPARRCLRLLAQGDFEESVAEQLGLGTDQVQLLLAEVWDCAGRRRRLSRPSPREIELLRFVGEELTHRELANRLQISVHTVPDMLERIRVKFLSTHDDVTRSITPMAAARSWARELGLGS